MTLQPVRRHGVDAAVMFADIMTPVVGMGIDVELVEGVGPVVEQPIRSRRRRRAPSRPRPRRGVRAGARGGAARPRRARRREGGDRVLRRPVHGRGLPRRGPAEPRASPDEGADALRARDLGRADGEAGRGVRGLRRGQGARRRGRRPALRLVGRDALAGAVPRTGRAVERRILDAVDVPTIHFGTGAPHLLRGSRGGGRRRDRARLAAATRRRVGARRRPRRPGEPRPGRAYRAVGRRRARGTRRARSRGRPPGSHLQPRSRRAARDRAGPPDATRRARPRADRGGRRGMTRPAVVLMAYGSPDRLADVPAYYADIRGGRPVAARAPRGPRRPLSSPRDRRLGRAVSAQRDHRGDASGPRRRRRTSASSPACATGSRGSRARSTRRSSAATTRSSASCSRPTGRRSRSQSTSSSSTTPWPGAPRPGSCGRGAPSPASSRCWRTAARGASHVVFTAHSLPARILETGDPYRESLLETSRLVADAQRVGRLVVRVPERVADGRALARPGHPRPPRRRSAQRV